jgi:hypothetical protein
MPIKASISGPLVVLDTSGVVTEDELGVLFDAFQKAAASGPFVVLTDTTEMKSAPRPVLVAFSNRIRQMPHVSRLWLGDAVVVTSTAVRFILSTLMVLAPLPTEMKLFPERAKARHWCAMLLRRHELPVPPELSRSSI